MSYAYVCNKYGGCRHWAVEYDVFTAFGGDTHVSNGQWTCQKRDDEMCVPYCTDFERKVVGE